MGSKPALLPKETPLSLLLVPSPLPQVRALLLIYRKAALYAYIGLFVMRRRGERGHMRKASDRREN